MAQKWSKDPECTLRWIYLYLTNVIEQELRSRKTSAILSAFLALSEHCQQAMLKTQQAGINKQLLLTQIFDQLRKLK